MNKYHNKFLFSNHFNYFYKLFFKKHSKYSSFYLPLSSNNSTIYGDDKNGYYIKINNGITAKVYVTKNESIYKCIYVSIYHRDVFLMNYNTKVIDVGCVIRENPIFSCYESEIMGIVSELNTFAQPVNSSIFIENSSHDNVSEMEINPLTINSFHHGFKVKFSNQSFIKLLNIFYIQERTNFSALILDYFDDFHVNNDYYLKLSRKLSFTICPSFYLLKDNNGNVLGFVFKGFDSSTYFVKHYNKLKIIKENLYSISVDQIDDDIKELRLKFQNTVDKEIKKNPSKNFFEVANSLGIEIENKCTISDEIFQMFEILDL